MSSLVDLAKELHIYVIPLPDRDSRDIIRLCDPLPKWRTSHLDFSDIYIKWHLLKKRIDRGNKPGSDKDEEVQSQIAPLGIDQSIIEQVMLSKAENPSRFASFWELDEEDINKATFEQIQNDPKLRTLWAAETGKLDVLQEMLQKDSLLVNAQDDDGYSPLHRAAYEGHVGVAQFLINHGAHVSMTTEDGWTPLHSAANWGQMDVAALLLRNGADVNAQTAGLQTALHLAAANADCREILDLLLLTPGAKYDLLNKQEEIPTEVARRSCRYHFLFEMCDDAVNKL